MSGQRFEINGYWLSQQPGGAGWYATWYDQATRRTRRKSLAEPDLEAAKIKLAAFVMEMARPTNAGPEAVRLAQVLVPYLKEHADSKPSAQQARIAGRQIAAFWGTALVSEITPKRQQEFIRHLASVRGQSPATISRVMSVVSAALRRSQKLGEMMAVPKIILAKKEIEDRAGITFSVDSSSMSQWGTPNGGYVAVPESRGCR